MSLLGLPDPIVSRETIHTPHGRRSGRLYPLIPLLQGDPDTSIMSGLLTPVVSRETFQSILACCSYVRSASFLILKDAPFPCECRTRLADDVSRETSTPFMAATPPDSILLSHLYKEPTQSHDDVELADCCCFT